MRFPVNDQGTGGLAKAAAVLAICPDGYIHLAGLEFTPKEFLDAGYVAVVLSKFNQVPTINVPDEFK